MILKIKFIAAVIKRELMHISSVLEEHLFQYFESDTRRYIEREIKSDNMARFPLSEITSAGKEPITFEIMIMIIV